MRLLTEVELFASAARTASANGTAFAIYPLSSPVQAEFIEAVVNITARSGTGPTLDLKLQVSEDTTTWDDLPSGAFPQFTSSLPAAIPAYDYLIRVPAAGKNLRAVATIAGTTPSWTFSLKARIWSTE
jgi:hypothetical protein